MSIFAPKPVEQPTPAKRAATSIIEIMQTGLEQLKRNHMLGFDYLWKSEATPDEILQEIGTAGVEFLNVSRLSVHTILSADPNAMTPEQYWPPRNFVEHADGTVTLAPPPEGYDAWGRPIVEQE